jgi:hypothetical protein
MIVYKKSPPYKRQAQNHGQKPDPEKAGDYFGHEKQRRDTKYER